MKKKIAIALAIAIVVVSATTIQSLLKNTSNQTDQTSNTEKLVFSSSNYSVLAGNLAIQINDISPTPSFGRIGWIAHRVSFVGGSNSAYIEYTDTHIALKMLVRYHFEDDRLKPLVLATFIPDEFGGWILQFGKNLEGDNARLSHFIFDGDSNQWIPELAGSE